MKKFVLNDTLIHNVGFGNYDPHSPGPMCPSTAELTWNAKLLAW